MRGRVAKGVLVTLASLALQGCWFIYIPAGLFSGPGIQAKLDAYAADIETKPSITAVAVAKDEKRWVFGGAHSAPTEERASELAITSCNSMRQQEGVVSRCQLYRVNGKPFAGG